MLGMIGGCLLFSFGMDGVAAAKTGQYDRSSPNLSIFLAPFLVAVVVGTALVIRRPGHRVGWLMLALGVALGFTGPTDVYTHYGALERTLDLPGAAFAAVLSDISYMPLLAIIALILLNTPSGRVEGRWWKLAGWVAVLSTSAAMLAAITGPYRGITRDYPIENPLELTDRLIFVRVVGIAVLHVALLASLGSVVLRFRRAEGLARAKLRWMALAGLPFVVLLLGAYLAAVTGKDAILAVFGCGFLSCFPLAIWIAVEREHLYDVDRLLSRSLSYLVLSAAVVSAYAATVVLLGQAFGSRLGETELPAVIGTLVAVSIALPLRRMLQQSLDRRFNRREFDALQLVRRFVHEPTHATTIESVLRNALADPGLTVLYWVEERAQWVTEEGTGGELAPQAFVVNRHDAPLAAISAQEHGSDERMIASVVNEALPELENARLRAAIGLQLVEVRESRARIVAAQAEERRRIERNLHDGAQQRLLGLAMQMRAAELSGDGGRAEAMLGVAVQEVRDAVRELRELANGLRPEALRDGGLAAALDDLAQRSPVAIRHEVQGRADPATEETAWFIVCEAVANAVKHANPASIAISALRRNGSLKLRIADDGPGGADPLGNGLRGIADRAEAAGGWLRVESGGQGTAVEAELPCVS